MPLWLNQESLDLIKGHGQVPHLLDAAEKSWMWMRKCGQDCEGVDLMERLLGELFVAGSKVHDIPATPTDQEYVMYC